MSSVTHKRDDRRHSQVHSRVFAELAQIDYLLLVGDQYFVNRVVLAFFAIAGPVLILLKLTNGRADPSDTL